MVRETAIGEGDVFASLKQNDLRRFVKSSQAGGSGGAAGHPANDANLHDELFRDQAFFRP
jgi:hypothetical protein